MGKHTPGPWHYPGTGNFVGGADRQRVADCYRDNLPDHERQSNARLIAAAPDGLKLAEKVAASTSCQHCRTGNPREDGASCCLARLFIAKARGEGGET